MRQFIPDEVQGFVVKVLESIWLFELRPYFQTIASEFKQDPKKASTAHPDFAKGVIAAMHHQRTLKKLNSFRDWDLLRFRTALEKMKKGPIGKVKGIDKFVKEWSKLRNPTAHDTHTPEGNGLSNMDLSPPICTAYESVPQIRGLNLESDRAREILRELDVLHDIVNGTLTEIGGEESEVRSHDT
jgi:hypothetical protein